MSNGQISQESTEKLISLLQSVVTKTEQLWIELLLQEAQEMFGESMDKEEVSSFLQNLPLGSLIEAENVVDAEQVGEKIIGTSSTQTTETQSETMDEEEDASLSMEERLLRRWKK